MGSNKSITDLPEDRAMRVAELVPEDNPLRLRVFHRAFGQISDTEQAAREQFGREVIHELRALADRMEETLP